VFTASGPSVTGGAEEEGGAGGAGGTTRTSEMSSRNHVSFPALEPPPKFNIAIPKEGVNSVVYSVQLPLDEIVLSEIITTPCATLEAPYWNQPLLLALLFEVVIRIQKDNL
jgi:hypothetical protein